MVHFAEASSRQPMFIGATVRHKLVGTRYSDFTRFEYYITRFSSSEAQFRVPELLGRKAKLELGEAIDLNLAVEGAPTGSVKGTVGNVSWDDESYSPVFGLQLLREGSSARQLNSFLKGPPEALVALDLHGLDLRSFTSQRRIVAEVKKLLADSIIRKKGIRILLRHLQPYFSRLLGRNSSDYDLLRASLWAEMEEALEVSIVSLEQVLAQIKTDGESAYLASIDEKVEVLREALLSELPFILCKLAFEKARALTYIRSVKKLEQIFSRNLNSFILLLSRAEELGRSRQAA